MVGVKHCFTALFCCSFAFGFEVNLLILLSFVFRWARKSLNFDSISGFVCASFAGFERKFASF